MKTTSPTPFSKKILEACFPWRPPEKNTDDGKSQKKKRLHENAFFKLNSICPQKQLVQLSSRYLISVDCGGESVVCKSLVSKLK